MNALFKPVAEEIIAMWASEGIPIIKGPSVYNKVAECYKKFQAMNKTKSQKREGKKGKSNEKHFEKLFDMAFCKCGSDVPCKCPYENRVPEMEVEFLHDQRGPRKMFTLET